MSTPEPLNPAPARDAPPRRHARRRGLPYRAARGGLAGLVATLPMSAVMLAARRRGLLGELPPETITEAMVGADGAEPPSAATRALAVINHLAYGTACGALYGLGAPRSSATRGVLGGAAFGAAVWVVSYQGWIPKARIMPPASRDRPGRPRAMLLAHLVYGATLGALAARRR